ncbi:UbiA family prenyltransferase [Anaeromyxobacter soli]|uniref:UbiA family prenyltransferase n=1 Tax=Anaeromyxobacter soli TaxID=2922725 RepID=UPI001FAEC137|nr:UbiA family prenyltransferase [Anaeromyxobacter sp. SG29]
MIEILRALRLHQWAKNVLVFLPLVAAHRLREPEEVLRAALAFVAFGLVASGVYVTNDLRDVEADRLHPHKRLRPFASGALSARVGAALAPLLFVAAWTVAVPLPLAFSLLVAGYLTAALAYSFGLKRQPIADVLVLAILYTTRIFAGAAATGIVVSEWLATFSMFLFLSLAFLKRASELVSSDDTLPGRGYQRVDREMVFTMGIGSGYLSVLVLALYVSSPDVRHVYSHPHVLWALCPLLLYWLSRLWLLVRRGEMHHDPLVFAMRDLPSYGVAGASALVILIAS